MFHLYFWNNIKHLSLIGFPIPLYVFCYIFLFLSRVLIMSYENIEIQGPSQTTLFCINLLKLFYCLLFSAFVEKVYLDRPSLWENNWKINELLPFFRSSRSQMFFKKDVLKNFAIFTGKHLRWLLLILPKCHFNQTRFYDSSDSLIHVSYNEYKLLFCSFEVSFH